MFLLLRLILASIAWKVTTPFQTTDPLFTKIDGAVLQQTGAAPSSLGASMHPIRHSHVLKSLPLISTNAENQDPSQLCTKSLVQTGIDRNSDFLRTLPFSLEPKKVVFNVAVMPQMSMEQSAIVDSVKNGFNVIVNAVAGSGKTTTILHIVAANPLKQILLLTYNSRLKTETRDRVAGFKNIEVHTYHSMGYKFYSHSCSKDSGLRAVVAKDLPLTRNLPCYDLIILDEAQDITDLLFEFVHKMLRDYQKRSYGRMPQFALLGDENQAIFAYKGADARYLTMAIALMKNTRHWSRLSLTVSYRVTGNMATFINAAVLGYKHITAHKPPGEPVQYLIGNPYSSAKYIAEQVSQLIRTGQLKPDDVFILAPSVKSQHRTPLKVLENFLCSFGLLVHLPLADDGEILEDVVKGKIVFSTFHQVKGLERPYVVVFSFSKQYFKFFDKQSDPAFCPPALYVAATRATSRLVLVGEELPGDHLPFLRRDAVDNLSRDRNQVVEIKRLNTTRWDETVQGNGPSAAASNVDKVKAWLKEQLTKTMGIKLRAHLNATSALSSQAANRTGPGASHAPQAAGADGAAPPKANASHHRRTLAARDLVQHVPDDVLAAAKGSLRLSRLRMPEAAICIRGVVAGLHGSNQSVADINGLAIPAMLEVESRPAGDKRCSMYSQLKEALHDSKTPMHEYLRGCFLRLRKPCDMRTDEPSHFLELAALYLSGASISRGYLSTVKQLTSYDWMGRREAGLCIARLRAAVVDYRDAEFETLLERKYAMNDTQVTLQGQVDIVTPTALWEVKCVSELTDEHFLQLAIYAWLWRQTHADGAGSRAFRIINVLTNEVWELAPVGLDEAVRTLLLYSFRTQKRVPNHEFLARAADLALPIAKRRRCAGPTAPGVAQAEPDLCPVT